MRRELERRGKEETRCQWKGDEGDEERREEKRGERAHFQLYYCGGRDGGMKWSG